jgi:methionine aminotransferase
MELKSKLPNMGTTIFSVMSALANKHNAINLSQGFPDFEIDPYLKELVTKAMLENQVQYAPMPGRMDLREAIARKMMLDYQLSIDPANEITITAGATQAIYTAIATIIQENDEVILFDPAYDCYAPAVEVHGGLPVHLELKHPTYHIDWEEVRASISENTKMIIVNNPHNPCGVTWSMSDLDELEKIAVDFPQLIFLSDEVYEHIHFEEKHHTILSRPILRERSFVTFSFGKTLHVTGWKIGYAIAPEYFTKEFRKIHQYLVFCVNNTMQYAMAKYLANGIPWKEIASTYEKKRDLFIKGIEKSRFKVLPCKGTYFCLLDYSAISDLPDVEFAKKMTVEYGVAVIPVSVFYKEKKENKVVRVCFAKKDETLIKAAAALCKI